MDTTSKERAKARLASISVRDLVSFVWRQGGLGGASERGLPNRALRGTRGHQEIQRKRPAGYLPEVSITYEYSGEGFRLRVFGRVDGVFADQNPVRIEEIKTVTRHWRGEADPLHWAQLRFYAAVYAIQHELAGLRTQLTYLDLDSGRIKEFEEMEERSALDLFLDQTLEAYLQWLRAYWAWCDVRDQSIAKLSFPFEAKRRGQNELIEGVRNTIRDGGRLFVEAATGLGKTMAVLFPSVQAFATQDIDRVFYLSAKNTGKIAATDALEVLRQKGLRVRSLDLKSKTSTCVKDGHPCDPETCPLAIDYFKNQKPAMEAALNHDTLNFERLSEIGLRFSVCPFELALDLMPFVDVILCDYHYVFDQQQRLRRSFRPGSGRVLGLIDECHNLVERGREMYSSLIGTKALVEIRSALGADCPGLSRALGEVLNLFVTRDKRTRDRGTELGQQMLFVGMESKGAKTRAGSSKYGAGFLSVGVPERLKDALQHLTAEMEAWFVTGITASFEDDLLNLYFELLRFLRLAEFEPEFFRCYVEGHRDPTLRLFCVDPASMLRESMDGFWSSVCFSGTLSPLPVFRRLLGGLPTDPMLCLASPFDPEQLRVVLTTGVDTRLRYRAQSEALLVQAILETVSSGQGSYLVFFSSYEYLLNIVTSIRRRCEGAGHRVEGDEPSETFEGRGTLKSGDDSSSEGLPRFVIEGGLPTRIGTENERRRAECVWQVPGMGDEGRRRLVGNVTCSRVETVVTFAVLGGLFGEAVDIPSERLKGVVVVGVGYPKISRERDLVESYFSENGMDGFEVAYLVPGMNRVVQAAGRLVRSPTDRGTIQLIDRRYGERVYRALLPSWWGIDGVGLNKGGEMKAPGE